MFLNFKLHSLIRVFFYLILIGVSIQSWNNLIEESTTFDETFVVNETRFPSFTLCPGRSFGNKSIESFQDVAEEIENAKTKYKIQYSEYKPYEEPNVVDVTYNQTLNIDWYFAHKVHRFSPFGTSICLIVTPLRDHKLFDWTISVSY